MRLTARARRRLILAAALVAAGVVLVLVGLWVVYPRAGAWYVRSKVVPRLEAKLGRKVTIGAIDIEVGHAVLRDITVRGPTDGELPLARIDRIEVVFDGWSSLFARARIESVAVRGGQISLHRGKDGVSNVEDLRARLTDDGGDAGHGGTQPSRLGALRPARATLAGVSLTVIDEVSGWRGGADELAATASAGTNQLVVTRPQVTAELAWWNRTAVVPPAPLDDPLDLAPDAPPAPPIAGRTVVTSRMAADQLTVTRDVDGRRVTIAGGEVEPWRGLALTGIAGELRDDDGGPGRLTVALEGGYGGVAGKLWTAEGWVDPGAASGEIRLGADKFSLERLRPILVHSSLVDYQRTTVDARLTLSVSRELTTFVGDFHLHDLTVGHPMLAEKVVPEIDISGEVAGSFERTTRTLALTRGDFVSRALPFQLTGTLALPGGQMPTATLTLPGGLVPTTVRRELPAVTARLVIPPIDCQRVLVALPPEMTPYMQGFKLRGTFSTDLQVAIDLANLAATRLDGSVGIRGCRVLKTPEELERLQTTFEHYVELERDQWLGFVIGPENPDFVPIAEVSPHLLNSLITTEDGAFYHHRGFLPREFKSALVKNLQAGYFKYGASSITMQTVKNVLLYREKTLSRKLQELFLTWAIEQVLEKDRIFEIYVNAIEYGPGLYGIGPAARHYFGKAASELTPREAAFFSSILPSPKARYRQYCNGTLSKWSTSKIDRIMALMLKRGRITQEEYDAAVLAPLVFVKDGTETEDDCNRRVNRALKKARSTNPLKK